ncbi:hypothetical protein ACFLX4_04135 [Chloroflexota bacterium]
MANRKPKKRYGYRFFHAPGLYNPIGAVLAEGLNIAANQGLQLLSRELAKRLGLGGMTTEDQIQINRSVLSVKKMEGDIAMAQRRQADSSSS